MQLVYGFVPNDGSLDALIERKASELAAKIVHRTSNTMKLEDQENSKDRIEKALIKKGVKRSQITFSEPKAMVQGPEYNKDAVENMTTYGQFQYIKVKAGPKQ